jgi:hypothetical protein
MHSLYHALGRIGRLVTRMKHLYAYICLQPHYNVQHTPSYISMLQSVLWHSINEIPLELLAKLLSYIYVCD